MHEVELDPHTDQPVPSEPYRAVHLLLGSDDDSRWARLLVRWWRHALLALVLLFILPSAVALGVAWRVLAWIGGYIVYVLVLEILGRRDRQLYNAPSFCLVRVHLDLLLTAALVLAATPAADAYSWVLFLLPAVAAVVYFGTTGRTLVVWIEICLALILSTLVGGSVGWLGLIEVAAQALMLGAIVLVLGDLVEKLPEFRKEERALLEAATTLI